VGKKNWGTGKVVEGPKRERMTGKKGSSRRGGSRVPKNAAETRKGEGRSMIKTEGKKMRIVTKQPLGRRSHSKLIQSGDHSV